MKSLFACLMILDITGLLTEKAEMIINTANKAFIYTAFCSLVSANTASQYLSIKSHIPWRDMASLSPKRKRKNKEKKKTEEAFVCNPLTASTLALNP